MTKQATAQRNEQVHMSNVIQMPTTDNEMRRTGAFGDSSDPAASLEANTASTLDQLLQQANGHIRAADKHLDKYKQHVIAAGMALIEAKKLTKHGQWIPSLEARGINRKTAARYMQFAKDPSLIDAMRSDAAERQREKRQKEWADDLKENLGPKPFDMNDPEHVADLKAEEDRNRKLAAEHEKELKTQPKFSLSDQPWFKRERLVDYFDRLSPEAQTFMVNQARELFLEETRAA